MPQELEVWGYCMVKIA